MAIKYFLILLFLNYTFCEENVENKNEKLSNTVEDGLENTIGEYAGYMTEWLKGFNDKHLIKSDLGKMLHYEEMKNKLAKKAMGNVSEARGKKMDLPILPLIFHLGMVASWMLMTTILTAKSVAIGMTLLILKVAAGSAKLASYVTSWKSPPKHHHHEHSHKPHYDYSAYSATHNQPTSQDWHTYTQLSQAVGNDWTSHDTSAADYKFTSPYQTQAYGEIDQSIYSPTAQKKVLEKKYG